MSERRDSIQQARFLLREAKIGMESNPFTVTLNAIFECLECIVVDLEAKRASASEPTSTGGELGGVERFRSWAQSYGWRQPELAQLAGLSDEQLEGAIAGAKRWIGGRRWSWMILAANYLLDGSYHV